MQNTDHERNGSKPRITPIYKRIEQNMRSKVRSGEWPAHMVLPGRARLAQEFNVGLPTIERAIKPLLLDGTLRVEPKRGTYIAEQAGVESKKGGESVKMGEVTNEATARYQSLLPGKVSAPTVGIIVSLHEEGVEAQLSVDPGLMAIEGESRDWKARDRPNWTLIMLQALERAISQRGGVTQRILRADGRRREAMPIGESIEQALVEGVDALAIVNIIDIHRVAEELYKRMAPHSLPVVTLSWVSQTGPLPNIVYDNTYAGYKAAEHLLQAGYGPLLFLDLFNNQWWAQERLQGAQAVIHSLRYPEERFMVYRGETLKQIPDYDKNHLDKVVYALSYAAAKDLLAQHIFEGQDRVGVIAANDAIAYGFFQAMVESGKRPGEDFGLIGFDDDPYSSEISLTSLRPPLEEIGQEAAQLLFAMLKKQTTAHQVRLSSHLMIRRSTHMMQAKREEQAYDF